LYTGAKGEAELAPEPLPAAAAAPEELGTGAGAGLDGWPPATALPPLLPAAEAAPAAAGDPLAIAASTGIETSSEANRRPSPSCVSI
jgi:hypothetical protein